MISPTPTPTPTLAQVVGTTILLLLVLVIVLVLTTVLVLVLVLTTCIVHYVTCTMHVTKTLLPDVGEQLTVCSGPSYGRRSGHCHETTG